MRDLTVRLPDERVLIDALDLRLTPGQALLLARPRLVFLDEATSALDEGIEQTLYTLLREELPEAVVVSVGHRITLNQFHADRLDLRGDGSSATGEPVG